MRLIWCLVGKIEHENEAGNKSNSNEQQHELMEALHNIFAEDVSAETWANKKLPSAM